MTVIPASASERRSVVKERMLSTILPKIAELSIEDSDTLFEVLSQGANRSQADVKKYLGKPATDRKKLVLSSYKVRWEKEPAFREIWPADRADLSKALKEWRHQQFVKRSSTPADSPQEAKRSGNRLSTHSSPAPNDGGHGDGASGLGSDNKAPTSARYSGTRATTSKLSQEK